MTNVRNSLFDEIFEMDFDAIELDDNYIDPNDDVSQVVQKNDEIADLMKQLEIERSEKSNLLSLVSKLSSDVQTQTLKKNTEKNVFESEKIRLEMKVKELEIEVVSQSAKLRKEQNSSPTVLPILSDLNHSNELDDGSLGEEDMDAYMSSNDIVDDLLESHFITSRGAPQSAMRKPDTPRQNKTETRKISVTFDSDIVHTFDEYTDDCEVAVQSTGRAEEVSPPTPVIDESAATNALIKPVLFPVLFSSSSGTDSPSRRSSVTPSLDTIHELRGIETEPAPVVHKPTTETPPMSRTSSYDKNTSSDALLRPITEHVATAEEDEDDMDAYMSSSGAADDWLNVSFEQDDLRAGDILSYFIH